MFSQALAAAVGGLGSTWKAVVSHAVVSHALTQFSNND